MHPRERGAFRDYMRTALAATEQEAADAMRASTPYDIEFKRIRRIAAALRHLLANPTNTRAPRIAQETLA